MSLDEDDMDLIRKYTKHMNNIEMRLDVLERLIEDVYKFLGGDKNAVSRIGPSAHEDDA